jgi:inorganic triphosphatase YgiF
MPHEIELKLKVTPQEAAKLRRGGRLSGLVGRSGITKILTSTYFDTPDLALRARGIGLRIRRIDRRLIQTLKMPIAGPVGTHSYREFEREVAGEVPDLRVIDDPNLLRDLLKRRIAGDLQPVFRTEFKRTIWRIKESHGEIEAALDVGEIRAGRRRMVIAELELELKSGPAQSLFDLALALQKDHSFTIEQRTKADRGYELASGEEPRPRRSKSPALDDGMTARAAFAAIAHDCIEQLRGSEAAAILGRDPEGVHQMRVGLRRLRALFSTYRRQIALEQFEPLTDEFDWLQRQLGVARDRDVFIAHTLQPLQVRLPDEPAIPAMLRASQMMREAGYRAMRLTLNDARYTRLLLLLFRWLADPQWLKPAPGGLDPLNLPILQFSARILAKRYRRLRKLGGKYADLAEQDLHQLRLQGKKLRYAAEFFRDLYPGKPTKRFIAAIADVQDHLGSLNDALVSRDLLAELGRRLSKSEDAGVAAHALGIVQGWQAARIDRDLRELRRIWKQFRGLEPFWEKGKRAG